MIDKVIIAEDQESSNLSVQITMDELRIRQHDYFYYCDDALNRIRMAKIAGLPYDVLITDLYFEDDGKLQIIRDGFGLIAAAREIQPDIRVIVFSAENKPAIIRSLYDTLHIDGFVRKARHDVRDLKTAFTTIISGDRYYSRETAQLLKQHKAYDFSEFDVSIIRLIVEGCSQKEIAHTLDKHVNTIEKRLKKMRDEHGFSKNEQLVLACRNAGFL
jgi:two-component system, NarL family, captular synthesis response regulator RcsB